MVTFCVQPWSIQAPQLPYWEKNYNANLTFLQRHSIYSITLLGATSDSLITLITAQVEIMSDHKTWPNPAIVV